MRIFGLRRADGELISKVCIATERLPVANPARPYSPGFGREGGAFDDMAR